MLIFSLDYSILKTFKTKNEMGRDYLKIGKNKKSVWRLYNTKLLVTILHSKQSLGFMPQNNGQNVL